MTTLQSNRKLDAVVITRPSNRAAVAVGGLAVMFAAKALNRKGAVMSALLSDWSAIAGPALATYTMPEKLTKGAGLPGSKCAPAANLHLKVDPARALDVQYKVPQLIERINHSLGYNAVGAIRLVQTPMMRKAEAAATRTNPESEVATETLQQPSSSRLDRALLRMKSKVGRTVGADIASR